MSAVWSLHMHRHRILTEPEQSSSHPSDPSSFHFIRHISNSHSMWGRAICMLGLLRKAIKQPPFTSRLPLIKLRVREAPAVGGGNTATSLERWKYDDGCSGVKFCMLTSWKGSRRAGAVRSNPPEKDSPSTPPQNGCFGDTWVLSCSDSVFISMKTWCFSDHSKLLEPPNPKLRPTWDIAMTTLFFHCVKKIDQQNVTSLWTFFSSVSLFSHQGWTNPNWVLLVSLLFSLAKTCLEFSDFEKFLVAYDFICSSVLLVTKKGWTLPQAPLERNPSCICKYAGWITQDCQVAPPRHLFSTINHRNVGIFMGLTHIHQTSMLTKTHRACASMRVLKSGLLWFRRRKSHRCVRQETETAKTCWHYNEIQ